MKTKIVYVAWSNTNLNDGHGWVVPLHVCEKHSTAVRLGQRGSVMGSDCEVTEEKVYEIDGKWVGPCHIVPSTQEDDKNEIARLARKAAIAKAKAAGLSDEELKALTA